MVEPWRPSERVLLVAAVNWRGRSKLCPPSTERANIMGAAVPIAPVNKVQLTYTLPKKGLDGFESAQTAILSLKETGFVRVVARTGALQVAPLSSEWATASSSLLGPKLAEPAREPT